MPTQKGAASSAARPMTSSRTTGAPSPTWRPEQRREPRQGEGRADDERGQQRRVDEQQAHLRRMLAPAVGSLPGEARSCSTQLP